MPNPVAWRPIPFAALAGWAEDDHLSAFRAFLRSCRGAHANGAVFAAATALGDTADAVTARAYFEAHFQALIAPAPGFVTGYYEPEVYGSREQTARFAVPVYGRPDDLVSTVRDTERARFNASVTGFRAGATEETPYYTRAEIDDGAFAGRGLELLYVEDMVELFYLQVQGSCLVHLDDGTDTRLSFSGKNGHPYTSIAKVLIERGELAANGIDMDTLKAWLRADPKRGRALMQKNASYVFFREADTHAAGPVGAEGVPLTPGRSLAVDTATHALGTPVFLSGFALEDGPFRRLMIAQDVGSAISGAQRGDIFFGTGPMAGAIAGRTRHAAEFHVLVPKR